MKYLKEIAITILAVMLIVTVSNYFLNPNVEIKREVEYRPGGKRDSLIYIRVVDSISYPVYIPARIDTFYAITGEDSTVAQANFDIPVSDSSGVSGKVTFSEKLFTFEDVIIRYPRITHYISQIDTLTTTVTVENNSPFTQIYWFYSTILLLFLILIK